MQKQTEIYMKQNHMTRPGDGVLVGLSGGADSVGLLLVLWKLRETFQISLRALHVHHIAEQRHQKLIQRLIISHSFPSHPWFQRAKRQFTLPIIQYSVRQDN